MVKRVNGQINVNLRFKLSKYCALKTSLQSVCQMESWFVKIYQIFPSKRVHYSRFFYKKVYYNRFSFKRNVLVLVNLSDKLLLMKCQWKLSINKYIWISFWERQVHSILTHLMIFKKNQPTHTNSLPSLRIDIDSYNVRIMLSFYFLFITKIFYCNKFLKNYPRS